VAQKPAQDSPWPPSKRPERFAALIRAEQAAILKSYAGRLDAMHSPIATASGSCDQAMTEATEILIEVAGSVQDRGGRLDGHYEMLAPMIGASRHESQPSPADLLLASTALFEASIESLAGHVRADPEMLPSFITAIVALNEGITRRIREATLAHTGYLLERVDQAHIDERHRIARDLHDRLGEGMSVALRQLELHELTSGRDPATPNPRAVQAKEAIAEAMRRLRAVTSDLRQDPVRSLEKALIQYIDSVAPDVAAAADVRLRVSGEETWAPPAVLDEAFLILREAIRNALRHGRPRTMLIGVALAPHELHGWVKDDGSGFTVSAPGAAVTAGSGLASMRERASLLGGRLAVASFPGQGTHVELVVPLGGHRDE
jgi:signal transduction histidine kinase